MNITRGWTISILILVITDLLGNLPAKSDRNFPCIHLTVFNWNSFTSFKRFSFTNLVRHLLALISWNINTLFYWNIIADRVGDQFLLGLWNILADIIRVGHTSAGNNNPDLLIPLPLPPVLTVLLVQGGALCLPVVLVLLPVLLHAHLLVGGVALVLHHPVAHWFVCVHAHLLVVYLALLLVLLGAHLGVDLVVRGVPHGLIVGQADYWRRLVLLDRSRWVVLRIARTLVVGGTMDKLEEEEMENYLHSVFF